MDDIVNPQDTELEEIVLGACLIEQGDHIGCRNIAPGSVLH